MKNLPAIFFGFMIFACVSHANNQPSTTIKQIDNVSIEQSDSDISIKTRDSYGLKFTYEKAPFMVNDMSDVTLLVASETIGAHYFLINVSRPSKVDGRGGRCAAGTERAIVWLKVSPQGAVIDSQEEVYESCLLSIEPDDLFEQTAVQVLSSLHTGLTFLAQMRNEQGLLSFDSKRPQDGLKVILQKSVTAPD